MVAFPGEGGESDGEISNRRQLCIDFEGTLCGNKFDKHGVRLQCGVKLDE